MAARRPHRSSETDAATWTSTGLEWRGPVIECRRPHVAKSGHTAPPTSFARVGQNTTHCPARNIHLTFIDLVARSGHPTTCRFAQLVVVAAAAMGVAAIAVVAARVELERQREVSAG